nr:hypothetical protein [Micromonospora globispora]
MSGSWRMRRSARAAGPVRPRYRHTGTDTSGSREARALRLPLVSLILPPTPTGSVVVGAEQSRDCHPPSRSFTLRPQQARTPDVRASGQPRRDEPVQTETSCADRGEQESRCAEREHKFEPIGIHEDPVADVDDEEGTEHVEREEQSRHGYREPDHQGDATSKFDRRREPGARADLLTFAAFEEHDSPPLAVARR